MRAEIEPFFSLVPEVALLQAVCLVQATYPTPESELRVVILSRVAKVTAPPGCACDAQGQTVGTELVAYPCDEDWRVFDWERRYEVQGVSVEDAMNRLRFGLANGLLSLSNHEGILADLDTMREQVYGVDWEQMPEGLQ